MTATTAAPAKKAVGRLTAAAMTPASAGPASRPTESMNITADITVQGWTQSNGALWQIGSEVFVDSPMAPLKTKLYIKTIRFTQGPDGTLTMLECVSPQLIFGRLDIRT